MFDTKNEITEFLSQYDPNWVSKFLFFAFGKYRYVHTLSEKGLDCYLSNLRSVSTPHPDDTKCVHFHVKYSLYNMVDYTDPKLFLEVVKKYINLRAFL